MPKARRPGGRTTSPATSPTLKRRRSTLAGVVAAAAIAAGLFMWRVQSREPGIAFVRTSAQNVLLITIDTLRGDALSSYGGAARTPNLDALAASGVRFTFAHAHAVVTLPSHASILTGRYPFDHRVRDNAGFRLQDSAVTLAEIAQARGFATAAFVGAFPLDRQFGLAQGFDVYDDLGGRQIAPADFAFAERPAADVVRAARAWIDRQHAPWLAWVHVFDPHAPYAPPPPFDAEYRDNRYAGEVAATDQALAPLLEIARRSTRPTLVVVTADHGEGLGDHGEPTHGVFAYESTLRVPLIVAQVGTGAPPPAGGITRDDPVAHIDILPTIADATGLELPERLPGRTLLDVDVEAHAARPSYFEAMTAMLKRGWAPLQGVIAGREKYILLPIEELYDLSTDPGEAHNLAPSSGPRINALAEHLRQLSAALPGAEGQETPAVRARLQSLGYLSRAAPRKPRYTVDDDPKRLIDVDRMMMEGIELHRAGRSAEAQDAYRAVIARRPDMALAYQRLAFIQWESGAVADAIATLRRAIDTVGPDVDIDIRLGTYLAETGAVGQAIPMLERAVAAAADQAEAYNALGIAYARAGRHADALRTFDQILQSDPRNAYALENVGAVHLQRSDLRLAAEAFARAAEADPTSSRARAGLGVIALRAGRREEAIARWREAVALDRTNYDALYNLATELVNAGRAAEARPYLERFASSAPPALYRRDIEHVKRYLGAGSEPR